MEIKQLRALLAIAEAGTVTGAAALLNTVQPGISRRIRLLEEELGVALFQRVHSGMVLTEEGRALARHAYRIIQEVDQAMLIARPKASVEGEVTIGLMRSFYERYSALVLGAVRARYPGIELKIIVGYSNNIASWLKTGEVDAALLHLPHPNSGLRLRPVVRESLCLVALPAAGLSMDEPIDFRSLHECPIFIPGYIAELREIVDNAMVRTGAYPVLTIRTLGRGFRETLEAFGGQAILPVSSVIGELESGRLSASPIRELSRTLSVAVSTLRQPKIPAVKTMTLIEELIRSSVAQGEWLSAAMVVEPPL